MSRSTLKTVSIDAPPEQVFAVLRDVERWPQWTSTMTFVKRLDNGSFTVGNRIQVQQPKLRSAVWQVTEFIENRNFTWITRAPGVLMRAGHLVEPRSTGCQVVLLFEVSGLLAPLVSWLYGNLIDEYVTIESQSLKQHCEAAATQAPEAAR